MAGTNLRIVLNTQNAFKLSLSEPVSQQIRLVNASAGSFSGKISIDTSEEWSKKTAYIPKKGEIVIYSDRHVVDGVNYPGIKIGDGLAYVVDLPFFGDEVTNMIVDILNDHINNAQIHVSASDREFWNSKINVEMDGESLVLTRN